MESKEKLQALLLRQTLALGADDMAAQVVLCSVVCCSALLYFFAADLFPFRWRCSKVCTALHAPSLCYHSRRCFAPSTSP